MDKRRLPTLRRIQLTDFSLYQNHRKVDVGLDPGVFCVAGANGLGKTSLLNAINFGYTGIVPNPNRDHKPIQDFYHRNVEFSKTYFNGIIDETDRQTASISLTFLVGRKQYQITRGLFQPLGLQRFVLKEGKKTLLKRACDPDDEAELSELQLLYAKELTTDCGLRAFEQFVFLQHYLFTFDERRHLLFWDVNATTLALYLALGMDADEAERAERLRDQIAKQESYARNAQWQSTQARKLLKELYPDSENHESDSSPDLVAEHQELQGKLDEAEQAVAKARDVANDAELERTQATSTQLELRRRYDEAFARRLGSRHNPELHPVIQAAVRDGRCEICGTDDSNPAKIVNRSLKSGQCPLCSSNVRGDQGEENLDVLKDLDRQLAEANERTRDTTGRLARLREDLDRTSNYLGNVRASLAEFESQHSAQLAPTGSSDALSIRKAQLVAERDEAMRRRDDYRRKKRKLQAEVAPLQKRLAQAYHEAEIEFVPMFRDLATEFIGLDLDIIHQVDKGDIYLSLEVQQKKRRSTEELSESQRFFLDIALRMTLARYMSDPESKASLLVDTPEGSLDIAYEARAGAMFAKFATMGHQIVMTANINASQLLLRLAERCTSKRMQLERITDWSPLSEVQYEEEHLFDEAFENIEAVLRVGNSAEARSS